MAARCTLAVKLLARPALVGDAVVDNVAGHDESVLEQCGIVSHVGAREQSGTASEDAAVANDQRVEVEDAARVDVGDERSVVDGNSVAEGEKVRLGEHEGRKTAREERAVFSNVGAQGTEVHDSVVGAGDHANDTVTAVALTAQLLDCEEELPALAVAALVPVVVADLASAEENPLGCDDHTNREEGLGGVQDSDEDGKESIDEDGAPRGVGSVDWVLRIDDARDNLQRANRGNVPVECDEDGGEDGIEEDGPEAENVVRCLALVESATKRR